MPSVQYYNSTAPFWDFVANLEEQGASHPFFAGNSNNNNNQQGHGETSDNEHERPNPWTEGWAGFPWGPFAHRGRHGPPGPPPPPPPPAEGEAGPSEPQCPPPPFSDEEEGHRRHRSGRRGHHGPGEHRGFGGRGGPCGRGRAFGHGRGRHFHPYAAGPLGAFGPLAEMFQNQLFGNGEGTTKRAVSEDFTPEADVFDTTESFVIHISLPGAKKEDVGVNWDADKSELNVAGVIYRPGDEDFLKTLAMNERKVGAFERKIRLGSRANPAQVDVDGITARMEDGVLRVEVPKLDSGYVEIKKVDIE